MVLFVLFCIIILAGIFLVGFFSMHLTKKIFHLDGVDTATTWKIVLYTFLPMLLPILGIFLAVYIFRSILNRIQKTSWPKTLGMFFIYFLISTILGVGFVLSARSVVSPFRMSGNSMESTLSNGRFMMVYRLDSSYQRWDIVIIRPNSKKENYVKRVIAISGDTVKFESGAVFLKQAGSTDFKVLDEGYLSEFSKGKTFLPVDVKESEFTVPDGQYFVMGDNRNGSSDSRSCFVSCGAEGATHYVKQEDVVGEIIR